MATLQQLGVAAADESVETAAKAVTVGEVTPSWPPRSEHELLCAVVKVLRENRDRDKEAKVKKDRAKDGQFDLDDVNVLMSETYGCSLEALLDGSRYSTALQTNNATAKKDSNGQLSSGWLERHNLVFGNTGVGPSLWKPGDSCEAKYKTFKTWYKGKIKTVHDDGTCSIVYDDGDNSREPLNKIRRPDSEPDANTLHYFVNRPFQDGGEIPPVENTEFWIYGTNILDRENKVLDMIIRMLLAEGYDGNPRVLKNAEELGSLFFNTYEANFDLTPIEDEVAPEAGARVKSSSVKPGDQLMFTPTSSFDYPSMCLKNETVVFIERNDGSPPAHVKWSKGTTYWVHWEDLSYPKPTGIRSKQFPLTKRTLDTWLKQHSDKGIVQGKHSQSSFCCNVNTLPSRWQSHLKPAKIPTDETELLQMVATTLTDAGFTSVHSTVSAVELLELFITTHSVSLKSILNRIKRNPQTVSDWLRQYPEEFHINADGIFAIPLTADQRRALFIRQRNAARLAEEEAFSILRHANSPETLDLVRTLNLPPSDAKEIGKLCAFQERLVGFDTVNKYIQSIRDDALGRVANVEPRLTRHVLITGNSGTGKRTAGILIGKWFAFTEYAKLLQVDKGKQETKDVWKPGDRCEALYKHMKTWYKAKINSVHDDGTYSIDYDDGDYSREPLHKIRRPGSTSAPNPGTGKAALFPADGSKCMLADDYEQYGDAGDGPMKPGQIYVIEGGNSDYKNVKGWSYQLGALRAVLAKTKGEVEEVESIDDMEELLKNIEPGESIYYGHYASESPVFSKKEIKTLTALFDFATSKKVRIIVGGSSACIDALKGLPCFRKVQASLLALTCFSVSDLAKMSLMKLDELGYTLAAEDHQHRNRYSTMKHIVRSKYDAKQIEERNAYLAADCIDLAITRKNLRLLEPLVKDSGRHLSLELSVADFDVKTVTANERAAMREAIDKKVAAVMGWGSEFEENSPNHWFSSVRSIILQAEAADDNLAESEASKVEENFADVAPPRLQRFQTIDPVDGTHERSALQPWEFNVVVEGMAGVGKTLFVEHAAEFLRAYGIMPKLSNVTKITADTFEKSSLDDLAGCLLVAKADQLAPNSGVRMGSGPDNIDESDRAEVVATYAGGANRFVALTCPPMKANGVLNLNPMLRNRFPLKVVMPCPSSRELATLAISYAAAKRGFECQEGLAEVLSTHIHDTYGKEPDGGIRFIYGLVDQAIRRSYERRATKINEDHITEAEMLKISDSKLRACDFEIGKAIGDPEMLKDVYAEVDGLIGMQSAKLWLKQFANQVQMSNLTGDKSGLTMSYNLVLTGAPGTGKTTFARMIHKFYKAHGVIEGEFVEKNALEMKGEYVGSTAPIVKAAMKEAKGGTLFLDEAYGLAGDDRGNDSFSKEAIRTLLTEVENNRTNTIVIMAGYKDKMQRFMREDPGLPRRFPNTLDLENYSPLELAQIASYVARKRFKKEFEPGLEEKLAKHFSMQYRRQMAEENGGLAVNLTEKAQKNVSHRVFEALHQEGVVDGDGNLNGGNTMQLSPEQKLSVIEQVKVITANDFGISAVGEDGALGASATVKAEVEEEVANLVAMDNVKTFFETIKATARLVEQTGNDSALQSCLNLVLTGNPGVGKSTTARIIQRYLHAYGVLQTNHFREVNALHLKGQYMGQTAHRVSEIVKDALGGCLFIDEAYSLVQDGGDTYGREVIRTLLTEVENHRSDLLVILAGYERPMQDLLDADAGLRRRFATAIHLRDYTGVELAEIAVKKAQEKKYVIDPEAIAPLGAHIENVWKDEMSIMNGGLSVNLVEAAIGRLAFRLRGLPGNEIRDQGTTLQIIDLCHPRESNIKPKMTAGMKTTVPDLQDLICATFSAKGMASARAGTVAASMLDSAVTDVDVALHLTNSDWEKMGVKVGERIILQKALRMYAREL